MESDQAPDDTDPEVTIEENPSPTPDVTLNPSKKFNKSQDDPLESEYLEISHEEAEDECSSFATNLKLQLRDLKDVTQRYIAEKLISDVMFFARTKQLNLNSHVEIDVQSTSQYVEYVDE